jgi:TPR repeat protein
MKPIGCLLFFMSIANVCFAVGGAELTSSPSMATSSGVKSDCKLVQTAELKYKNLLNTIPKSGAINNKSFDAKVVVLAQSKSFQPLSKIAMNQGKCSAKAALLVLGINGISGKTQGLRKLKIAVAKSAKNGDPVAIKALCYDPLIASTSFNKELPYCKLVFNGANPLYDKNAKHNAASSLAGYYYRRNQASKLIHVCNKSKEGGYAVEFCHLFLRGLASDLYSKQEYRKAFKLYSQIASFDKTGSAQFNLGKMYENGWGVRANSLQAIYWYKQAFTQSQYQPFKLMVLNQLGFAYVNIQNYLAAFQCYKRAAEAGVPLSQYNLARLYSRGLGTIEDDVKAYAWVSLAVAKGMENQQQQKAAQQLQMSLDVSLAKEQTATKQPLVKKAHELAKQYYDKYVLHKAKKTESIENKWKAIEGIIEN